MTLHDARQQHIYQLMELYDASEAINVAELVMEHITGWERQERILNKETPLSVAQSEKLKSITERLLRNEPVQYVLEEAWFYGMKFHVNKNVLIPRPETEELADWVIKDIERHAEKKHFAVLDIGTGSGCIPISVRKKIPGAEVSGIDVCSEALYVAATNAANLEADINLALLDFLNEEERNKMGHYDIIISNPPYIRKSESDKMIKRVTDFEPAKALFVPDDDPLIFYKAIADFGKSHLSEGGTIYLEINEALGNDVTELFKQNGYANIILKKDMQGKNRMMKIS